MIIARAPYRVSFGGGGTDLPAFCDVEPGMVVSCTIDRHIYVTLAPRVDGGHLVRNGEVERAESVDGIRHGIARECLRLHGIDDPMEVTIAGDLPGGTGLGSSSALTVAMLAALDAWRGRRSNAAALARAAGLVEMGALAKPIGYQDQYAAAFGGLNAIRFRPGGHAWVSPMRGMGAEGAVSDATIAALGSHCLLLRAGGTRAADDILREQSAGTPARMDDLRAMARNAEDIRAALLDGDMERFGRLIHRGWCLKRGLAAGIAGDAVDRMLAAATDAGAWGGKLLGAGGAGFLLVVAPPDRHDDIRSALGRPRGIPLKLSWEGARVIHGDGVRS